MIEISTKPYAVIVPCHQVIIGRGLQRIRGRKISATVHYHQTCSSILSELAEKGIDGYPCNPFNISKNELVLTNCVNVLPEVLNELTNTMYYPASLGYRVSVYLSQEDCMKLSVTESVICAVTAGQTVKGITKPLQLPNSIPVFDDCPEFITSYWEILSHGETTTDIKILSRGYPRITIPGNTVVIANIWEIANPTEYNFD